jgi:hypothetical protein
LRPRREDAPTEVGLPGRHENRDENAKDRPREQESRPDESDEPVLTDVDATLRPLARALLALAEQLSQEEGP